ncbi:MAG: hypothetical protein NTZ09_10140 [Candidatus Hydrogenedentes bacterium]|nr:hypothetical protein [Candidatus Hydrogenedentota bacterium]
MKNENTTDLVHDLVLPTVLFATLGAMTWAIRGCSGFGGESGCLFAGVLWAVAWWFIAREPAGEQSRPYSSGWVVLAMAFGIAISGMRGWMQWPAFFEGHLQTNYAAGEYVPISRAYGFLWLFIAGVPWAGLGACMLAWCGSHQRTSWWQWLVRIGCGVAGYFVAMWLYNALPQVFLPLYSSMAERYQDWEANPNLRRLINDNRAAITHLGVYLGFLGFEIGRKDWRNVTLILTVGVLNGLGWAALQNWKWAPGVWPEVNFNWWRCWESSGGISIGIAYGVAYFLVNRRLSDAERVRLGDLLKNRRPNLERFAVYLALVVGLGMSIKNGLKGWANIYLGSENYWDRIFFSVALPLMVLWMIVIIIRIKKTMLPKLYPGDVFPHAVLLMWVALITHNGIAQLVTASVGNWVELSFSVYYLVLFAISGTIIAHYHFMKKKAAGGNVPSLEAVLWG